MEDCILLMLNFIVLIYRTHGIKSECSVPEAVKKEDASLTCTFEADISNLLHDFEVRHVPVNASVLESEVVLSCHWNQEKARCRSRPGYVIDGAITQQFTINIQNVQSLHAGKYVCLLVPSEPGTFKYCDLIIIDDLNVQERPKSTSKNLLDQALHESMLSDALNVHLRRNSTNTSLVEHHINDPLLSGAEENKTMIVCVVILTGICPIILFIIGLIWWKKRSKHRSQQKNPKNEHETDLLKT